MRLIETMCSVVVLSVFAGICASAIPSAQRLFSETERLSREYDCDRFIVGSFRRLCTESVAQSEIDEWRRLCMTLWQLEKIEVSSAGFDGDGHRVLRCSWKRLESEKNVFVVADYVCYEEVT